MKPSISCSLVNPYFASPGLSIIELAIENSPPGLNLQLIVSGIPISLSITSICVKSSRLIIAPSLLAYTNSSGGVSLDENIISSPLHPIAFESISSVFDEQSVPHPYSLKILIRNGFGVAFTAKYSLKPGFHANASLTFLAFSLIPFSS